MTLPRLWNTRSLSVPNFSLRRLIDHAIFNHDEIEKVILYFPHPQLSLAAYRRTDISSISIYLTLHRTQSYIDAEADETR